MDTIADERELVLRAKGGSEEAFTDLVDRYHERIYRIALRIVHDPDDAEEVVQEVFVRAVTHIGRFDFRASFYTWLVSITRNAAFDALRGVQRRGRFKQTEDGLDRYEADGVGDPVEASQATETAEKVRKALGRLKPRDRTLIVLREYEGLRYEEIARVMECSVGTIESGLHRARKRLKMLLGDAPP